jgi:hypothetical protein
MCLLEVGVPWAATSSKSAAAANVAEAKSASPPKSDALTNTSPQKQLSVNRASGN